MYCVYCFCVSACVFASPKSVCICYDDSFYIICICSCQWQYTICQSMSSVKALLKVVLNLDNTICSKCHSKLSILMIKNALEIMFTTIKVAILFFSCNCKTLLHCKQF